MPIEIPPDLQFGKRKKHVRLLCVGFLHLQCGTIFLKKVFNYQEKVYLCGNQKQWIVRKQHIAAMLRNSGNAIIS